MVPQEQTGVHTGSFDRQRAAAGRVLLFGAGTMGRVHAASWQRLGCEVVCVVDPRLDAGATLADEMHAHHCASPEAARAHHADTDIADIAVPTFAHRSVLESLPTGPRLIVMEKPLERDPERASQVLKSAQDRGVSLFVAQVLRFFPGYRALRATLLDRGVQDVQHVRMRRVGPSPHGTDDWFLDEDLSGGLFIDLLIHDLDFCLWTFGPPDRVMARVSQAPADPRSPRSASRHATAMLSYEGRRVVHLEGSWMFPGRFSTRVEADADWGTLVLDSEESQALRMFQGPADASEPATSNPVQRAGTRTTLPQTQTAGQADPYTQELQAALQAYRTGEPLPVLPDEALQAVVLADLCRTAAADGSPMPWPCRQNPPTSRSGATPCVPTP